jgi:hypothetical protein
MNEVKTQRVAGGSGTVITNQWVQKQ